MHNVLKRCSVLLAVSAVAVAQTADCVSCLRSFGAQNGQPLSHSVHRGCAPETVKGKAVVFSSPDGHKCSFLFRAGNADILSEEIRPGYGNSIRYTRTGPDTATLVVEEWEFIYTYTMRFSSATSGTASQSGYGEGMEWSTEGISFELK